MRIRRIQGAALTLALAVLVPAAALAASGPHIEGTYRLVKRVLPDGKEMAAPDIVGMTTYTAKYRNFNIMWKDPSHGPVSISYVAEYQLTADKYCEHPLSWLQNNLGEPGLKYEVPANKSDCTKVTIEGKKITFSISGEPPRVTFEGDQLVATAEGQFVDYWIKVK